MVRVGGKKGGGGEEKRWEVLRFGWEKKSVLKQAQVPRDSLSRTATLRRAGATLVDTGLPPSGP